MNKLFEDGEEVTIIIEVTTGPAITRNTVDIAVSSLNNKKVPGREKYLSYLSSNKTSGH